MLMRRSAPQPAIKKTPRGGTEEILSQRRLSELGGGECSLKIVIITTTMAERAFAIVSWWFEDVQVGLECMLRVSLYFKYC